MQINNKLPIRNNTNYTKANKPVTKPQLKETKDLPKIDAQYYRANCNIAFKGENSSPISPNIYIPQYDKDNKIVKLNILTPTKNQKYMPIILEDNHLKYVLNKNGEVEPQKLNTYSNLYKRFYTETKKEAIKEAADYKQFYHTMLQESLNRKCEELGMDLNDFTEEEIQQYFFQDSNGKSTIPSFYQETIDDLDRRTQHEYLDTNALVITDRYMHLYDEIGEQDDSYIDRNEQLIKDLAHLQCEHTHYNFDIINTVIKTSYFERNMYDLDYMEKIVKILDNSGEQINRNNYVSNINVINNVLSIDENNQDFITEKYLNFLKEYQENSPLGLKIFMQAFNPVTKQFDEKAFQKLLGLVENTSNLVFKDLDQKDIPYEKCVLAQERIINDYFGMIRDEKSGEIKDQTPDEALFIECHIPNYLK